MSVIVYAVILEYFTRVTVVGLNILIVIGNGIWVVMVSFLVLGSY